MEKKGRVVMFYSVTVGLLLAGILLGNRAVTSFSENLDTVRKHCIVIDPGHGGEDGGAVSDSGISESVYNLEISLRLNDLINLLGYQTKMIRYADVSVYTKGETLSEKKISDLKERVRVVNETDGALLLSIHQNYYADSRYSGAQTFYADTDGSESLAKDLQADFVSVLNPGSRRMAKKSNGVYLMEHIRCPGVLIECGFLSNPPETRLLKTEAYQKKLCSVIATVTCRYLANA